MAAEIVILKTKIRNRQVEIEQSDSSNLFTCNITASSHPPRRLGVVEEKNSVVAWLVVSVVSISGNVPEVFLLDLWVAPCPNHGVVVSQGCVRFVLLGWSM